MSYDYLHDMILESRVTPSVIVSDMDDFRGNVTRVFKVNTLVSTKLLVSDRMVDGKLFDRDNVRATELAEVLMKSLMSIPGVTSVVLGSPSAFSLQVTKRSTTPWDELQRYVLTFFSLRFNGWMGKKIILIDPSKKPLGSDVAESNLSETEIDPTAFF